MPLPWEQDWSAPQAPVAAPAAAPVQAMPWEHDWSGNTEAAPVPEKKGAFARALDYARSIPARVQDAYSGEGRREEGIDELPENIAATGDHPSWAKEAMALARDNPKAAADIAQARIPGSTIRVDQWGNPIIRIPQTAVRFERRPVMRGGSVLFDQVPVPVNESKEYYLNKPGLSAQDAVNYMPDAALLMAGGAGGAKLGQAALGEAGKIGGAGVGSGGASVIMDLLARAVGSKQPVDWKKAGWTAAFGSAGQAIGDAGGWLLNKVRGNSALFDETTQRLTDKGRAAVRSAGYDPEGVSAQFSKEFADRAAAGATPEQAAAAAAGQALPVKVGMTKGDISRDVSQQAFEDSAAKGVYGEAAKNKIVPFRQGQQDALRANVAEIPKVLGGGQVATPGEGATAAATAIRSKAQAAKTAINEAYDAARSSEASITGGLDDLATGARAIVEKDHNLGGLTRTNALLNELDEIATAPATAENAPIRRLFEWRAKATAAKAAGGEEAVALRKAINEYDGFMQKALDNDLLAGDENAIDLWRKAIAGRAEYGRNFESNKIVQRFVDGKVEPDQAVNYLFGTARLGMDKQSAGALKQVKDLLGENSPQWRGLKEEAFLKMAGGSEGQFGQDMQRMFSGDKFASQFDNAMRKSPTLMRTLYTPQELSLIQNFRDTALRATNRVPGAVNYSGSATELARIARNLFGVGSDVMTAIYGKWGRPIVGGVRAESATTPTFSRPGALPYGAAAAGAGVAPLFTNDQKN